MEPAKEQCALEGVGAIRELGIGNSFLKRWKSGGGQRRDRGGTASGLLP